MPSSLQDVFDKWIPLGGNNYHIKLFMLAIILWVCGMLEIRWG